MQKVILNVIRMNNMAHKLGFWIFATAFIAGIFGAFASSTVMAGGTSNALSLSACLTNNVASLACNNNITVDKGALVSLYGSYTDNGVSPYTTSLTSNSAAHPPTNCNFPFTFANDMYTCNVNTAIPAGTYYYEIKTSDSAGNSITITTNLIITNPLSTVTLSEANNALYQAQSQSLTANAVGGAADNVTFYIYNSSGSIVNTTTFVMTSNSYTYSFVQSESWGTGTFTANAVVTDTTNGDVVSSKTVTYTVYSNAPVITLTLPASNTTTYDGQQYGLITASLPTVGNQLVLTVKVTGNYFNGTVIKSVTYTTNSLQNWTSFYVGPQAGNYVITATTTGNGNYLITQTVNNNTVSYSPVSNTVVINPATLSATDLISPATYPTPSTATFNGVPTFDNQSAWTLYVNGAPTITTASLATYTTVVATTYSLLFSNHGNNNYYPFNITASMKESYNNPGSGIPSSPPAVTTTIAPLVPANNTKKTVNTNTPSNTINITANNTKKTTTVNTTNTTVKQVATTVATTTVAPTNKGTINTSAAAAAVSAPASGSTTIWIIILIIIIILLLLLWLYVRSKSKKGSKKS
jgi:hypothetical protein